MSPSKISKRTFLDRVAWVDRMVAQIRALPVSDRAAFMADSRNIWAAESCIRRALEAIFDIGRHLLAKGFGAGVSEYKAIAEGLKARGVLTEEQADLMKILAGYRNRMVHFYHEISIDELYQLCAHQLADITATRDALRDWVHAHPELVDPTL